ncbi:hypothetical protein KEJ19_06775 [Candidatus Bathyarchaeota archaeon]|nr:hypothetical protein [Candidatus Bathyarchaeota archaeon]
MKNLRATLPLLIRYYNVRYHMALRKAPCGSLGPEPLSMLSLVEEAVGKA